MHDLHIWAPSSGKVALTAHVEVEAGLAREDRLENALGSMLKARFGITHATVQAELPGSHGGRDPHAAWPAGAEGAHEHGCADGHHGHGHGRPSRRVPRGLTSFRSGTWRAALRAGPAGGRTVGRQSGCNVLS